MSNKLPTITSEKIWESNKVLQWGVSQIGFSTWRKRLSLFFVIAFPFLFSSIATISEQKFSLGQVSEVKQVAALTEQQYSDLKKLFKLKSAVPKKNIISGIEYTFISLDHLDELLINKANTQSMSDYLISNDFVRTLDVRGMSYIGDTMVWPFYILVPTTLLLLGRAIRKIQVFFDSIRYSIIERQNTIDRYDALINESTHSFSAKNAWKWVSYIGLIVGISFVAWNSITCTFPETIHPYKSHTAYISDQNTPMHFANNIDLPKWDTNIKEAPASWFASRLWVIFGYLLIPIMLTKLVNLIAVLYGFCSKLSSNKLLKIKPLSSDSAGGFSTLSDVALSFVHVIIPVSIMLLASFMKESTPASLHNYFLVFLFIPIFFSAFFLPLISFHIAMKTAKTSYLRRISEQYNELNDNLLDDICNKSISPDDIDKIEKNMGVLKRMYEQVKGMTEWPVEIITVYRFIASFSVPPTLAAGFQYIVQIIKV
jgi:hypothetical protein